MVRVPKEPPWGAGGDDLAGYKGRRINAQMPKRQPKFVLRAPESRTREGEIGYVDSAQMNLTPNFEIGKSKMSLFLFQHTCRFVFMFYGFYNV